MATKQRSTSKKTPWQKPAPRGATHKHLSVKKKASAKARARRAGRPYPNLVDNMRAAAKKKSAKKRATRKKSPNKKASRKK